MKVFELISAVLRCVVLILADLFAAFRPSNNPPTRLFDDFVPFDRLDDRGTHLKRDKNSACLVFKIGQCLCMTRSA
jgi:hypothetical protein